MGPISQYLPRLNPLRKAIPFFPGIRRKVSAGSSTWNSPLQGAVGGPVFQTRQILQGQGEDLPAELELVADADSVGDSLAGIAFHEGTVVRAAHVLHKNFENVSLLCGEGKFMRFVVAVDGCLMRAVQIHQGAVAGFVDHDGLILNVADQFCAVENESE